jgi:hypothetical protein
MSRAEAAAARAAARLLLCLLAAFAVEAQGPGNDFRLRFSAGYSDNIFRGISTPESGSFRALGFQFSSAREGERLRTDFNGDIEVRDYSLPAVDNEPVGSITALLGVDIVPDRFEWLFEDSYGQTRVNQFVPVGPTNRQDVNIFATGPRVTLPLGARTRLQINGEHQRRRFQNTSFLDNDSDEVLVGVLRSVNPTTDVGLSWTRREITADLIAAAWEDDTVFITYQRRLASGAATLRVGENTVRVGGAETSGPLFDASWARDVGSRSRLTVTAVRDFVDPGDQFRYTNAVVGSGLGSPLPTDVLLGAGVYELSSLTVASTTSLDRTSFSFGVSASKAQYRTNTPFDNESRGLNVAVDHEVSALLGIGLQVNVYTIDLLQLGREDVDRWARLYVRREIGRRLDFQFSYLRNSRDSQGIAAASYDENSYQVTLLLDLNP